MSDWFRGLAVLERGKLDFNRAMLQKALGKHQGHALLILRPVDEFRSNRQNSYYWGVVIPAILGHPKFHGWTDEQLHDGIKEKFLSRLDPETGLTKAGSTRELSKQQFSEFKEAIQQWAAETLDLYIPDPNEDVAA